jgi:hypothetical protein
MTSTETRPSPGSPHPATARSCPRWVELLPSAALGIAFTVKAILQPNAVRDVFSGTQAFLVALAILVGWLLLWLVVLPRLVRNRWVRVSILAVVAAALVVWLVVFALVDKKVVETRPSAAPAASRTVDDGDESDEPDAPSAPAPAEPIAFASGPLRGIDHDATGTAVLYERPDGTTFVGLENIDIEPGPDYKVYVVPGANRERPGDDGVFLDSLRGNQGTQFYEIPAGTAVTTGDWTVLVWCRAFAVPIANASF